MIFQFRMGNLLCLHVNKVVIPSITIFNKPRDHLNQKEQIVNIINILIENNLILLQYQQKMLGIHLPNNNVTIMVKIIVLLAFIPLKVKSQQQTNFLIDGDFSMVNLSGGSYRYFSGSIPGWNCTNRCEVDDCLLLNQYYQSGGSYNANCTGMVLDLISDNPQNLTQSVNLTPDIYILSLNYYYPRMNSNCKTFQIFFNEVLIFNLTPNVSYLYLPQYFQYKVQGISGVNTLRLTTLRNSGWDVFGFSVNNFSLTLFTDTFKQFVKGTILNDLSLYLTQIPGSRVIFGDIMGYFINFDRLQFYYYHDRNYSDFSTLLLKEINILNGLKGQLLRNIYEFLDKNLTSRIDNYFSSIDYKYTYSSDISLMRNPSNGGGFVNNCYDFFVYTIPSTIIVYLLFVGLFRMVRNRSASKLIRKYSFFGLLIFMFFEGNIESLTYYSFGQLKMLFSANFQHKTINIFIINFQWLVTLLSVGSILWLKYHYHKKIFYFLQNKKLNSLGLLCQIVENGIICLVFGIVHQMMYWQPQMQLLVLFIIQGAWMKFKIYLLFNQIYQKKASQFLMFTTGITRMCFIVTFYYYQQETKMRTLINNSVHKLLVAITLLLWLKEFIVSFVQLIIFYYNFCKRLGTQRKKQSSNVTDNNCIKNTEEPINEIGQMRKNQNGPKTSLKSMTRKPIIRHTNQRSRFNRIKVIQERIARIMSFQQNRTEA